MVQAKSVGVGGAEAKDLNVVILDHPTIEFLGQFTGGLDGSLDFNLLKDSAPSLIMWPAP